MPALPREATARRGPVRRLSPPPRTSPYQIPAEGAIFDTAFGEDAEGLYFRLGSGEAYVGEDENGMWIDPTVSPEATETAANGLSVEVSGFIPPPLPPPPPPGPPPPPTVVPTGVTWDDSRTFEELGNYTFEEIS